MKKLFLVICLPLVIAACSTTTKVTIPQGAKLYVNEEKEPVVIKENGEVTTRPFFWSAIAGIPFRLELNEKTINQGKLEARFRPASIFWPPYAIIYWPVGFAQSEYDLTKETQNNGEPK
jgi:hypothetical protein